jgi:serine/threonine protein kinase
MQLDSSTQTQPLARSLMAPTRRIFCHEPRRRQVRAGVETSLKSNSVIVLGGAAARRAALDFQVWIAPSGALMLHSDLKLRAKARVGTTLLGKYRLESVLGIGGMAAVYAATHKRNAKRVAIKVLHTEISVSSSLRTYFQREGYAANSVGHRGAVLVDDDDVTEDGAAFLVMELLEGTGVERLQAIHGGRLPVPLAVAIVEQVLEVLSAAHAKGIVHRDIKPANLFLIRDGWVKVLDFGIARVREFAGSTEQTATSEGIGTPGFMAPEQALGQAEAIDAQTDVWGTGATLFNLLSGELPHTARSAQELRVCNATKPARRIETVVSGIPVAIADVVNRALALDKEARWLSAAQMRSALCEAYASSYGGLPERVTESQWEPPLPERTEASVETTSVVAPGSIQGEPASKMFTERPVASGAARRRASRWPAASILVAIVLATAMARMVRFNSGAVLAPPAVDAGPSIANLSSPKASASSPAPEAPSSSAEVALPRVTPIPPRPSTPPPPKPPPPLNCDPPTTVDTDGVKYPKHECQ